MITNQSWCMVQIDSIGESVGRQTFLFQGLNIPLFHSSSPYQLSVSKASLGFLDTEKANYIN